VAAIVRKQPDISGGPWFAIGGVMLRLIMLAVLPWYVPVLIIVAAIAIPVIARRRAA
jgi:hypothetical protein